jgi:hypothetical protein
MRQASQASINPRSSPQGANKRPHGPIPPNWPRRAAQSRRDLCLRRPQTYRARFYTAWVTCGRRPGKSFFDVAAALVGCGHVSGLLMRQVAAGPIALRGSGPNR